jgi:cell division protein FtsI (penicillin-binding protein 3)
VRSRTRQPARRQPARRQPAHRPAASRPLRRGSSIRRLNVTLFAVALAVSLIVVRLVQLQGVDSAHYRALSQGEKMATQVVPPARGEIISSDGTVLAMTVQFDQVIADPGDMKKYGVSLADTARALAGPLRMTRAAIMRDLSHPSSPEYVVLKTVGLGTANAIARLRLAYVSLQPHYTRVYPQRDLAAPLLGFTDTNQETSVMTGQAGLEQDYNRLLAGRSGEQAYEAGNVGQPIPGTSYTVRPVVPAGSLRLTIQADVQWQAEHQCALAVARTHARTCTVIVMQPRTGKVIALAQYPTFNPNGPITSIAQTQDLPVAELFAPGSTAKVITAAAAFTYAGQTPLTSYLVPDALHWNDAWYHDAEPHPTRRYTIAGIIAHSLNDGMVQVASHVTPAEQYKLLRAFGLGSPSGLDLPGETAGLLPHLPWTSALDQERYQVSFGQGVGVTAMQMASVYATIADGGVRVVPSIVAGHFTSSDRYVPAPPSARRRVISRTVAAELMAALEQVPGTYARAGEPWGIIPNYSVAAKTGTAQQLPSNAYGSSFIGMAPASSDGLVVAVNIQDPRNGQYFGIDVAGPVFNAVMKFALATLRVPPDGGHVPYVPLTAP